MADTAAGRLFDRLRAYVRPGAGASADPTETSETSETYAPGSDEAILAELNERFAYACDQWAPILREGAIDVQYAAGDTWDEKDRTARTNRPVLNLDQLSQYTNQLANSYRQNPRGANVSPAGGGASLATAELRADRIRQIEHDSHAQEVYTVAGENAATRGYGYARLVAEYEDHDSDNQVLRLKAIPNPDQVLPDPDAESTSGADWQYLFFVHSVTRREFRRDWPDAKVHDFDAQILTALPRWFGKDGRVLIAEYWTVTKIPAAEGRGRPRREVAQYLTNGLELLHQPGKPTKTIWQGSSIPFAACYGKIVYSTDEAGGATKMLQSYIRLARDGAKAYNWTASTKLEALALPVKAALFAYVGQLGPEEIDLVERSTREPIALIQAHATTEATGQQVLPLPQYGTRAPDISGYEIAGESFRRDIQNALGRYSAQDHRVGSTKVTSGVALQELRNTGDLGSYHFVAHYDDMIRELAVKIDELLPYYDDTAKEIDTRTADGKTKRVAINQPTHRRPDGLLTFGPRDLRMDPAHRHTITIATGPAFDSQQAAAKDAALTLLNNPQAFPLVAADCVRLMSLGPIGKQMAEDLEYLQPPAMRLAKQQQDGPGGAPDPRILTQQIAQLKEQIQHAEAAMQQLEQEAKGKQLDNQSKEKIADLTSQRDAILAVKIQTMKDATAITVAKIQAMTKGIVADNEAQLEQIALAHDAAITLIQQQHAQEQATLDRAHEAGMAAAQVGAAADAARAGQLHQAGMAAAGLGADADAAEAARAATLAPPAGAPPGVAPGAGGPPAPAGVSDVGDVGEPPDGTPG
jgi:hypothetical protein